MMMNYSSAPASLDFELSIILSEYNESPDCNTHFYFIFVFFTVSQPARTWCYFSQSVAKQPIPIIQL